MSLRRDVKRPCALPLCPRRPSVPAGAEGAAQDDRLPVACLFCQIPVRPQLEPGRAFGDDVDGHAFTAPVKRPRQKQETHQYETAFGHSTAHSGPCPSRTNSHPLSAQVWSSFFSSFVTPHSSGRGHRGRGGPSARSRPTRRSARRNSGTGSGAVVLVRGASTTLPGGADPARGGTLSLPGSVARALV